MTRKNEQTTIDGEILIKRNIPKWKREVYKRDNYKCKYDIHGDNRSHKELNVHHVIPRHLQGKDLANNAILVCRKCHLQYHPEFEQLYFKNTIVQFVTYIKDIASKIRGLPKESQYRKLLKLLVGTSIFRVNQLNIIKTIVEKKKDVLAIMPTGSGKSVLYQIPGLLDSGQILVISPLISLQVDQVRSLQKKWIPTTYINAELNKKEKASRIENILDGNYKFVFAHPKQFLVKNKNDNKYSIKFHNLLTQAHFSKIVIDETHVVHTFGRDFIPEYSQLRKLKEHLNNPQLILLTATASEIMQDKIIESLDSTNIEKFVHGFYRPEIRIRIKNLSTPNSNNKYSSRIEVILEELTSVTSGKSIVFVPTRKIADELGQYLKSKNLNIGVYHAKVAKEDKLHIQKRFKGDIKPELKIMVATSAFGMGVDIPNIRKVIHYSIPFSVIDYYQQIGRAGRDGDNSEAVLLYRPGDEDTIRNINNKSHEEIINDISRNGTSKEKEDELQIQNKVCIEKEEELQKMIKFIDSENHWQYILDYFGEQKQPWFKLNYNYLYVLLIGIIIFIMTIYL